MFKADRCPRNRAAPSFSETFDNHRIPPPAGASDRRQQHRFAPGQRRPRCRPGRRRSTALSRHETTNAVPAGMMAMRCRDPSRVVCEEPMRGCWRAGQPGPDHASGSASAADHARGRPRRPGDRPEHIGLLGPADGGELVGRPPPGQSERPRDRCAGVQALHVANTAKRSADGGNASQRDHYGKLLADKMPRGHRFPFGVRLAWREFRLARHALRAIEPACPRRQMFRQRDESRRALDDPSRTPGKQSLRHAGLDRMSESATVPSYRKRAHKPSYIVRRMRRKPV